MAALGVALAGLAACGPPGPATSAATRIPPGLPQRDYPPPGWSWGELAIGQGRIRYGVAPSPHSERGQALILPDAGEPAEAWFETARALLARNLTVWIMDLPDQGGSSRSLLAGARLHAKSLDGHVKAVEAVLDKVVRARPGRPPLVVIGDGLGGQIALRVLADRPAGVAGAVIGAPTLSAPPPARLRPFGEAGAAVTRAVGLGVVSADTPQAPRRSPNDAVRDRSQVAAAWMAANPQIRVEGASLDWPVAVGRSVEAARDPARLAQVKVPVLMGADPADGRAAAACKAVPACQSVAVKGGDPHLAADPVRRPWLAVVEVFMAARQDGYVPAAPPVR